MSTFEQADFIPPDKKASNYANCPVCQQVFYKTSINKHIRYLILIRHMNNTVVPLSLMNYYAKPAVSHGQDEVIIN